MDITLEKTDSLNGDPLLDSLITGIPLPISFKVVPIQTAPKKIKQGIPSVSIANKNIISIKSPGIMLVSEEIPTQTPNYNGVNYPTATQPVGLLKKTLPPDILPALSPTTTDAAYYNLQYLDVDQGLTSSYVMDIMEDARGNLWISTWATGVCMYNSKSFINYNENCGLINNYIWCVFEDSQGNIWFGSDGMGVSKYDGNSFIDFSISDGLSGNVVYKIVEDERNNIWFATNEGLTKYDGENFYSYTTNSGLIGNTINDIYVGSNNQLLIATDNGFSIFDGVLFTHYTVNEGLIDNNTSSIFEDSEGNIWIGTAENGVCKFDGYTFFSFDTRHGLSDNSVTKIMEDDYNRVWVGSANNGLSIYDRSSFIQISREQGLSSNTIRSLYQDSNMNIWIGTNGGLNKYNERSFQNYTDEQGLGALIIRGISEDQYGNIWFGHSNGVSKFNGQTYENYNLSQGLSDYTIRAITQDHLGNLWFGTEGGGAIYYDGEYFTHYTMENGMSDNTVLCMYEDIDNNMWFGTISNGISVFNGEGFKHLTMDQGLSSNTIRSICQDADDNIWIGTNGGGLEKFDGENIIHNTKKEGLSGNTILSLMLDEKENLWIGTENDGVNILSNEKIYSIGVKNGLSNGIIWSIVEDYENNIWLGTEKGLNLIEIEEDNKYNITNFGKLDGLKGTDFYPNSVCLDSDNKLWWGTGKALSMLDLNKYERIKTAPSLTITDVLIDESLIDYRELKNSISQNEHYQHDKIDFDQLKKIKYDSIHKFSNFPSNIELPYNLNHLTIHFSANDWTAPHKIKYAHKLEGASNEWHTIKDDNKVVLSYLPEGNYIFHLKAIGEAEIWTETLTFNIIVHPPWWKTIWAYFFYILFVIVSMAIITSIRTKKLIHQRKLLEKLVSERTEELVKQKELVESKNKEIIDSITYAKRIQRAILPSRELVKQNLANALIYFKPKDIVAGDFYWLEEKNGKLLLAAADCTGHGVPGAMISLVCNNALGRAVKEFNLTNPALILNKVRHLVIEAFTNSHEEVKDGMDIALISIDTKTNLLHYAGANNNLYIVSDNKIHVLKADRQPIGKYVATKDFSLQQVQLKAGDSIYMFTDGYIDQFGGKLGKKFKVKQFLELILSVQHLSMYDQKKQFEKSFLNWKGNLDQVDDICIIGVKI